MTVPSPTDPCPCGSQQRFADCCAPYLQGAAPPTAEALMRSRYSAYCTGQLDYLIATHHPRRRPNQRLTLQQSLRTTRWLGLQILATQRGQPEDDQGWVEFVAFYQGEPLAQLHERSQFIRHRGRWSYLEGESLPPLWPKRNQPCWCGSGQKFKQCHGRHAR